MYVTADRALWRIDRQGGATHLVDLDSNLGVAAIGPRDVLVADFGPTNAFAQGPNDDGIVWRVTPEGDKTVAARGIGDPNFILVLLDGSFLVSDDATDEVFIVRDGVTEIFTRSVRHPNGLALSPDGGTLYVAQMFRSINPNVADNRVWAVPLSDGAPSGEPLIVARLAEPAANDGLLIDPQGRVYVAANGGGKIWRIDPADDSVVLIADNVPGVASMAFGRGDFDRDAIYATSTRLGAVWRIADAGRSPER